MSPISETLFTNSLRHVRRELKSMGFGTEKILKTKVSRTLMPSITKKAYFTHGGEIIIPIFQRKKGVRDMLRHEYGHALLYHYPKIGRIKGWIYFGHSKYLSDYVSSYAMENPGEDFCETFMIYLKYRGKPHRKFSSSRLKNKWRFISRLPRRLGSS